MFKAVVDLLMPYFTTEKQRQSLLAEAFSDQYLLPYKIDYSGPATQFTPRLVVILQEHGEISPQTQALWYLLLTLRDQAGPDLHQRIDSLEIWANQPHKVATHKTRFMAERPPLDFVARPVEFEPIVQAILAAKYETVAITAALKGAGGFGKTTLARAVCHDPRIKGVFEDGILWVTLGEKVSETELISKVLNLVEILTDKRPGMTDLESAKTTLRDVLNDASVLLVIDDVWTKSHLTPFLNLGQKTATLITTRNSGTLPQNTAMYRVDAMQTREAVQLLGAGWENTAEFSLQLKDLSARLGEWPLLLKLANSALHERPPLDSALEWIKSALSRKGFKALDDLNDPNQRHAAAHATLDVSLSLLAPSQYGCYERLAIFAEDVDVPLAAIEKLWRLDNFEVDELCIRLMSLSLLLRYDRPTRTIRLHDVIRTELRERSFSKIVGWNADFLEAYALSDWSQLAPEEPYLWRWLAYHLHEANQLSVLRANLLDPRYLQAKLNATNTNALIADCDENKADAVISLIKSALNLSSHILEHNKAALGHQLIGRLMEHQRANPEINSFITALIDQSQGFLPFYSDKVYPTHTAAGSILLRTLAGHTGAVASVLELQDGRLLSWAGDHTLRLWATDGSPLRSLEGYTSFVVGVLELHDGCLLSWPVSSLFLGSHDYSLRLWATDGSPLRSLEGHTGPVAGVLELHDGRLLSWPNSSAFSNSHDYSLRLWATDGSPLRSLEGHTGPVAGVLELHDGRLLSWADGSLSSSSRDYSLRLWAADGSPLLSLKGHTSAVTGVLELHDGRLLSWSNDHTLRLWAADGLPLRSLGGHTSAVTGVLELHDGRLLSWADGSSRDYRLRLWAADGSPLRSLGGHTSAVTGVLELHDGRLLSWAYSSSRDYRLRLWAADGSPLSSLKGHNSPVAGALELRNGRLLSWSNDHTLRLWAADGSSLPSLKGHTKSVVGALELRDGRLLSWSNDHTLRLWAADGPSLPSLKGHTKSVVGVLELRDGRFLSWASDKVVRLWAADGSPLRSLKGHTKSVVGALELRDSRLLSWAGDHTLRLWATDGSPLRSLEGHTSPVVGALELHDSRLLSWADGSLSSSSRDYSLRLWATDGSPLFSLKGHLGSVAGALELHDGRLLSWSDDVTLRLWATDGSPLRSLKGHTSPVVGVLELHDGRLLSWPGSSLFSGPHDYSLRLWATDGSLLRSLEGHTGPVAGVLELHDGRLLSWADGSLSSSSHDYSLRLWATDGSLLRSLEGHTGPIVGVLELHDGRLLSWADGSLSSSSHDYSLRLWAADGSLLRSLEGHTGPVAGVLELHDGRLLSWATDNTLRLWDSRTGQELAIFYGDDLMVCCVALQNGNIVVGDQQGRIIFLKYKL